MNNDWPIDRSCSDEHDPVDKKEMQCPVCEGTGAEYNEHARMTGFPCGNCNGEGTVFASN